MKVILMLLLSMLAFSSFAGEHALGSHEHGSIKLGIAVEKNLVDIDLDGPSESFIGFEYLPKTDKEKKVFNDVKVLWEKNIFSLISFDKKLNCKIAESSFKQLIDGAHSEIEAKAKISCAANLAGSEITISLKKQFAHIKKLSVDVLSAEAKTVEITKAVQSFKL